MTIHNRNPYNNVRIALFLPTLEGGGAERMMAQLASGFSKLGIRVDLILVKAEGVYLSQIPPEVRIIDLKSQRNLGSLPGLVRYLRAEKPQVLLSALDLTNLIAVLATSIAKVKTKVILSIQSTVSRQHRSMIGKRLERILLSWIYPWADSIVAVSKGSAEDLAQYTGIDLGRICTIHNPVITPELEEKARKPVDHPWFRRDRIPVILAVGRLTKAKDYPTLFRALARVKQTHLVRLVVLGEGEERANLEHLADQLGITSDIDMPGFTTNPFAYMSKVKLYVLSSIWEGLPSAMIEAMACGCPIVSTDCQSGPDEILSGGEYGYLVPVGDSEALADAIVKVLSGETRYPPPGWLEQYELMPVLHQYLKVMGLSERQLSSSRHIHLSKYNLSEK